MNILHFSHVSPTYCVITHLYSRSALRDTEHIESRVYIDLVGVGKLASWVLYTGCVYVVSIL